MDRYKFSHFIEKKVKFNELMNERQNWSERCVKGCVERKYVCINNSIMNETKD